MPVAAGRTAIPRVAGEEAVLALDRVPVLCRLVLWCRHLLDGGDDQALVGAGRAAAAACPIAAATDEGLIRLEKAAQRTGRILAQPVAQLVRSDTSPPVRAAEIWPRRRACRDPSGRRRETTSPTPSASDETRFPPSSIPADGRWRIRRPAAEPSAAPSLPPTAAGTHKTAGPAKPSQVLDAPRLRPEPGYKIQKSSHSLPLTKLGSCYPKERRASRTFSEPALTRQGNWNVNMDQSLFLGIGVEN